MIKGERTGDKKEERNTKKTEMDSKREKGRRKKCNSKIYEDKSRRQMI